ncbi:MAG: DapH/DapD/GlmU-related protein [Bacillota bacterium]|nr:DapH/DapD/GlmU-related protein [Bacillota bacterium]
MKQAIILATNMNRDFNSSRSLLVHEILGTSIFEILLDQIKEAGIERLMLVGPEGDKDLRDLVNLQGLDLLYKEFAQGPSVNFDLDDFDPSDDILLIGEFNPFLKASSIKNFFQDSIEKGYKAAVLSSKDIEKASGVYYFKAFDLAKKELDFYSSRNISDKLKTFNIDLVSTQDLDEREFFSLKTRRDLSLAQGRLKEEILDRLIDKGVSILDPSSTIIGPKVEIAMDTIIYPGVRLLGKSQIGSSCIIEGDTSIINSQVGNNCHIKSSYITDSTVYDQVTIGPFAQLRPKSIVRSGAHIGNFVELKKTDFGQNSKAGHLAYLGDSQIGQGVNIGCGVITVNYDGNKKHQTIIEDKAFIGSNSNLIAPVKVNKNAFVAAGSTITKDVEEDALAIERTSQVNIKDWVKRKKVK